MLLHPTQRTKQYNIATKFFNSGVDYEILLKCRRYRCVDAMAIRASSDSYNRLLVKSKMADGAQIKPKLEF